MKTKDEVINGFLERHTPEGQVIRSELNGVWDSGYHKGYAVQVEELNKRYEEELNRQYNKGYANGLKEAQDQNYQNGYDKGADDARYVLWWAVSNIILSPEHGGLGGIANERIFGTYFLEDIFMNFTPEEIIEKVKDYKEGPKKSAPTNREKFEEVFGFKPDMNRQSLVIMSANGDLRKILLDEPYEEPADGN